jgi:Holliday junction resolvase
MVTPESKVKEEVKKVLGKMKCYFFSPTTAGYGKSGVPDIIACINSRFVGIECKASGKKPTALQYKNLDDIKTCGGATLVVNEDNLYRFSTELKMELNSSPRIYRADPEEYATKKKIMPTLSLDDSIQVKFLEAKISELKKQNDELKLKLQSIGNLLQGENNGQR